MLIQEVTGTLDPSVLSALLGGAVGAVLGALLGYFSTSRLQRQIWRKDFDRFQAEQLISLFENMIICVESRTRIEEQLIDRMTARALLLRYLDQDARRNIDHLKKLCFQHRDSLEKAQRSTTARHSQEEDQVRKEIRSTISELMDKLRDLYAR